METQPSEQTSKSSGVKTAATFIAAILGVAASAAAVHGYVKDNVLTPLSISVDYSADPCTGSAFLESPEQLSPVPPLSSDEQSDRGEWVQEHGGFDANRSQLVVTMQGSTQDAIVIEEISVLITDRRPAPPVTHVAERCGGPLFERLLIWDIDVEPPVVESVDWREDLDATGQIVNDPLPTSFAVTNEDLERFIIRVQTFDCFCSWVVGVRWTADGSTRSSILSDNGRPFVTVGTAGVTPYATSSNGTLEPLN